MEAVATATPSLSKAKVLKMGLGFVVPHGNSETNRSGDRDKATKYTKETKARLGSLSAGGVGLGVATN